MGNWTTWEFALAVMVVLFLAAVAWVLWKEVGKR